mgnify:CR=1 FL=1
MGSFLDSRLSVGVAAPAGQKHPLVMKSDVMHQCELIIGNRLLKRPEEIIRRRHQKRAVLHRILLISPKRRVRIFLRNTVKPFDKCFDSGRECPEIQRGSKYDAIRRLDFWYQLVKGVLLNAGFPVAAGIAAKAPFTSFFIREITST